MNSSPVYVNTKFNSSVPTNSTVFVSPNKSTLNPDVRNTVPVIKSHISESCFKEALPCEISPLGYHLSSLIKEKIWRGGFRRYFILTPLIQRILS